MQWHLQSQRRLFPGYNTRLFPQDLLLSWQGRCSSPLQGKGFQPRLTSGSKIGPTARNGWCPQRHSTKQSPLTMRQFSFWTVLPALFWLQLGLAESHSYEGPPYLFYCLLPSPYWKSVRWWCEGRAKREKEFFLKIECKTTSKKIEDCITAWNRRWQIFPGTVILRISVC